MFANKSKWDSLILQAGLTDFGLGLIVFRFVSPGTHSLQNPDYSLLKFISIFQSFSIIKLGLNQIKCR